MVGCERRKISHIDGAIFYEDRPIFFNGLFAQNDVLIHVLFLGHFKLLPVWKLCKIGLKEACFSFL